MRNRFTFAISAAAVLAVLAAADASAQERRGGWFGVGGGWGSTELTCDDCGDSGGRENSGVVYFDGGFTLNEHVLAGAEFNLWTKSFEDPDFGGTVAANFYNLLGTVTVYPSAGVGGFFMKGGAGVGFFDMDVEALGISATFDMGKGLALIAGAGYDIPVGPMAITPAVNYWYGSTGDLSFMGETLLKGLNHNTITATVGVKWP